MQVHQVFGCRFELPTHYQVVRPIGQGAGGVVCAVQDVATGTQVGTWNRATAAVHCSTRCCCCDWQIFNDRLPD